MWGVRNLCPTPIHSCCILEENVDGRGVHIFLILVYLMQLTGKQQAICSCFSKTFSSWRDFITFFKSFLADFFEWSPEIFLTFSSWSKHCKNDFRTKKALHILRTLSCVMFAPKFRIISFTKWLSCSNGNIASRTTLVVYCPVPDQSLSFPRA